MKKGKIISQAVLHAVLIVLAVICLTPFLSMVSSSFMDIRGVLPDVPVIFPETPLYTENYVKVWTANNFSRYFVNTLLLSAGGLVVNVAISISMAYSFSRFKFPGRELLFNVFLLTMMVPAQLALISQYTVLNGLHLIDNYAGILRCGAAPAWPATRFSTAASLKACRVSWRSRCSSTAPRASAS